VQQRLWRTPLQAMWVRQLHSEYRQPFSLASSKNDDQGPKSMTARQLMQEMLGETS